MLDQMLEELRLDCTLCKIDRGYKCGADFGIIIGFNDEVVCIKKYDRDGLYDGLKVFTKSDIETLQFSGNELHSRTKFIQNHGAHLDEVKVDWSGFDEFLDSACSVYGYVSLNNDSENSSYIGPVLKHDEEYVHIRNFGNPTCRDRQHIISVKWKFDSIEVDSIYARNLMSIHADKLRA